MTDGLDAGSGADDGQRLRLLSELVGVPIDPQRLPAVAAYLAEVRQLADELLGLDLDAAPPGAIYDPRWPENGG